MSRNRATTLFLKECMADSLLKLMRKKDYSKITINEICIGANVNRSTWFRNFKTKNEALTFKLVYAWSRWADEHGIEQSHSYTADTAPDFFKFNFENRDILRTICEANLHAVIYKAFYEIVMPPYDAETQECYTNRFLATGIFGMLTEWIKREFKETPEEMADLFGKIISNELK